MTVISQHLTLTLTVLIQLIPNNTMRYIALVFASLSFAIYLILHKSPTCQVAGLDISIKHTEELFRTAVDECTRDPRFIFEAGLKLTEAKYVISSLHTKTINTKYGTWRMYPYHLTRLVLSIRKCQQEMKALWSAIVLELECARQENFQEDIKQKVASIARAFPSGKSIGGGIIKMEVTGRGARKYGFLGWLVVQRTNFIRVKDAEVSAPKLGLDIAK
ncbi:hypothetical protein B0H17DRAFT_1128071 [Mycena rosella]|uniref:Uncharacterized protein n=1 Tax=Mycena rosella TaxID=1033263 RepID=A0AAD7GMC9_MYCRO|nr:hypothetical protein B0H17DRAFT_1128071 [Mycena rosella]